MAEEDSKAVMLGIIVKPWPYKALTALGVTATSFVAGQTAALTYSTLPAIMDSTAADLARHWRKATDAVSRPSLVLSVVGAGSFAVLAYREPARDTSSFRLYTAATTILAAGYAYDALVTRPVNDELVRREELSRSNPSAFALSTSDAESASQEGATLSLSQFVSSALAGQLRQVSEASTHQLADRWGWLNLGRAALTAVSAFCGAYAIADEDLSFFSLV